MKKYRNKLGYDLEDILKEYEEASLVKNRYKTIRASLKKKYPSMVELIKVDGNFIKDILYVDRKLRQLTEGKEKKLKKALSDQWQVDNGYHADHKQEVSKLATLL